MCGDGAVDAPEQCDDGNLSNGDGCSNACTLEKCGNGTVDTGEQCDDSNATSGDGCSKLCSIEFCGDSVVSPGLSEECDDGNGLSGDGCSSLCKSEGKQQSSSSSSDASQESSASSSSSKQTHPAAPEEQVQDQKDALLPVAPQAVLAAKFLQSPESAAYRKHLNEQQEGELFQIMQEIEQGKPLTAQEHIWAQELLAILIAARAEERARYTDLLQQFIASPISAAVVREKGLSQEHLVGVAVPIAVDELNHAIEVIKRGELKTSVLQTLDALTRQDLDIKSLLPADFADSLGKDSSPITVFETLKTIKEAIEKHATTDLGASLELIRTQVAILKDALPILEREYGIRSDDLAAMLDEIDAVSRDVTAKDASRVVGAINRFLGALERRNVLSSVDLLSGEGVSHAAAHAARILEEADIPVSTAADVRSIVTGLSNKAPPLYKKAFEQGTLDDQKKALLDFLANDERLTATLSALPNDQQALFTQRLETLKQEIKAVGLGSDTETTCDDSMSDALQCTSQYLSDLQEAARSQSFFSDLVGRLQDFFGIGS